MTETGGVLTFLIADVRGYTSFTRQKGDEAAARLAAKFAEISREGVEWHGGTVTELRGDEALAIFASPRAALRAAMDLQRAYADESAIEPDVPLHVGIGLDAGEAVEVEGGYRGSALNLASRLCSEAGPGEVLLSQGMAHLVGTVQKIRLDPSGTAELKGLPEPVGVFKAGWDRQPLVASDLQRAHDVPAALQALTPMIGRDAEIRHLRWSWRLARRRDVAEPLLKVVYGPTGIGKTRLLAELASTASATGQVSYVPFHGVHGGSDDVVSAVEMPALLVIDDVETASKTELAQLEAALAKARPGLLVVLAANDENVSPELTALLRRLAPDTSPMRLAPLTQHEMARLAALYLGDSTDALPAEILARSGGVPRRLHEEVGRWAYEQATRRLGALATQAAADRTELRSVEADLAGTVIDLQLVREQSRLFGITPGRYDAVAERAPYLGLASFQSDDADVFFGRERLVAEMVARLAGASMLGVVGPSGSGKSSAVHAGLVPALRVGALPGSERWTVLVIRPGEHPARALERALWAALPKQTAKALEGSDSPLLDLPEALGPDDGVAVVIDQFEEVFTACADQAEQLDFLGLLAHASARGAGRLITVPIIRADLYGRCAAHPALADLLGANHVLVGPMSAEEYRRVIVRPAARTMVDVEPELVDDLIGEVLGEPGALPLLSTALLELWTARDGSVMRRSAYLESGGVQGAVARLAERVYTSLDATQQTAARNIFLRLAGAGEGDAAVRRRVPLAEFDAGRDPTVAATLDALTAGRLLTISDGFIELAHEALLREWPRLQAWLDEDRDGRRVHAHLTATAADWDSGGRDAADLYRGARLAAALDWAPAHRQELNERERDFVVSSREQSQRELVRQRRQNRQLRGLLTGVAVLLIVALTAGFVALAQKGTADAAARTALARQLGAEALIAPRIDQAMLLAREAVRLDPSTQTESTLLSTLLRAPSALGTFSTPVGAFPVGVAVSPDGRTLAVTENNGVVEFFDTRTYRHVHSALNEYNTSAVGAGVMGYAGPYFYSVHTPPTSTHQIFTLDLFNAASMAKVQSFKLSDTFLSVNTGFVDPVLGSPDGSRFWFAFNVTDSADADGHTYVDSWDASSGAFTEVELPTVGLAAAVLLSGNRLMLATDNAVVTLDGSSMREIASVPIQLAAQSGAVISPDGRRLAVVSTPDTNTFTIWDLTATPPHPTSPAAAHSRPINALEFTPESGELVTGSADQTAAVWDAASGALIARLTGLSSRLQDVGISPDGSTLYTASSDGVILQWDLSAARSFGRPFQVQPLILPMTSRFFFGSPALAISADNSRFAVRAAPDQVEILSLATLRQENSLSIGDGTESQALAWSQSGQLAVGVTGGVDLWDVGTVPRKLRTLTGIQGAVKGVAFSPDGHYVAASTIVRRPNVGSPVGWLGVWDQGSGRLLSTFDLGADGRAVAFSPDSPLLVTAMGNNRAVVFDYLHGRPVRMLKALVHDITGNGVPSSVEGLAFLANGDLLMGEDAGVVETWDPRTGQTHQHPLQAEEKAVASLSVLPDQSAFATTSQTGDLKLWDSASLQQFGSNFPGSQVWSTASVTLDGKNLVVVSADGSGFVWPLALASWIDRACTVAHRNLTQEEWSRFVPGQPYQTIC